MAVLQLLEREELQKLQKRWWYDKGECVIETEAKVNNNCNCNYNLAYSDCNLYVTVLHCILLYCILRLIAFTQAVFPLE